MIRRFIEHVRRPVLDLEGFWDFAFLGDVAADAVDLGAIAYDDRIAVPGCFDASPRYAGRRGLAAYRRRVALAAGRRPRLLLSGVHHWCRVHADGLRLGEHSGGYTVFALDLPQATAAATAEIVVLVDNRIDYGLSPLHLPYFDWYHFGGIARGAELHALPDPWIEEVRVDTVDLQRREVEVRLRYGATRTAQAALALALDGRAIAREQVALAAGGGVITRRLQLAATLPWSPDAPHLYTLAAELGDDDLAERIGLREVLVAGRDILLNGEPLRLRGFNRHDAHPQFGAGLPDALLAADVQILQDLGCNFVRGSHYPQDPRFLDLCDEAGLLVWSEATGWQHTSEHLNDPRFLDAQSLNIREMIAVSANHPSVFLWGLLNESASHEPASRPGYERLIGEIRRLDPTRPVTYASNHWSDDALYDLADVISINTYPGWYTGELETLPAELDRVIGRLEQRDVTSKPAILSEIGAGAVPGWRDQNRSRWSEEYQAALLETVIRHVFESSRRFMGLAIWQFCDGRTTQALPRALSRPRGFNNKGIVDEYRRPKLAYDVVKRLYRGLAG
jgi:beta-glucuronidase